MVVLTCGNVFETSYAITQCISYIITCLVEMLMLLKQNMLKTLTCSQAAWDISLQTVVSQTGIRCPWIRSNVYREDSCNTWRVKPQWTDWSRQQRLNDWKMCEPGGLGCGITFNYHQFAIYSKPIATGTTTQCYFVLSGRWQIVTWLWRQNLKWK